MSERAFETILKGYERILKLSLHYRAPVMILNLSLIAVSGYFFVTMPKGFFPQEDTGMLTGFTQADQDVSFEGMKTRQEAAIKVILQDPDVLSLGSFDRRQFEFGI